MKQLPSSPLVHAPLSERDAELLYRDFPDLPRSHDHGCPTCHKNRGKFENGVIKWRGEEWECNCLDQLQRAKHYLNAGIGDIYQRLSYDDWVNEPTFLTKLKENYLANLDAYVRAGIGIVATGTQNGTGKTMLMAMVLKELVQRQYRCYMTTFSDLLGMITGGWRSEDEREEYKRKVEAAHILLIDDIGKEHRAEYSNFSPATLESIIRTRVQNARPTLVTMNLTMPDFANTYGKAVDSLITERSLILPVHGKKDFRNDMNRRIMDEIANGETRPIF